MYTLAGMVSTFSLDKILRFCIKKDYAINHVLHHKQFTSILYIKQFTNIFRFLAILQIFFSNLQICVSNLQMSISNLQMSVLNLQMCVSNKCPNYHPNPQEST